MASGALGLLIVLLAACTRSGSTTAFPVGSVPTTGPLYLGPSPFHDCTASVVSSPTQDLLITAAHCLWGTGRGMTFAPGSVNGSQPYGRWKVVAAYADPGWIRDQDPLRDVAFLRVAPAGIFAGPARVQQVTGGNRLVATPAVIGQVQVPAYAAGVGGRPFDCLATAYRTGPYSAFDCGGYVGGTSGAPFIHGSSVLGVIGGLHQGGCSPSTSYSSPFDATTIATFDRAVSGAPGDTFPVPGSDGC